VGIILRIALYRIRLATQVIKQGNSCSEAVEVRLLRNVDGSV